MYSVEYINCKVCGNDRPKFLGIRGNREHAARRGSAGSSEHMVTNVVKCRNCGFVYTNPKIAAKVDAYSRPDDYLSSGCLGPDILFGVTLNLIERYSGKGKLLDIGCGKGEFLSVASKRGWEGYGLEPSEKFAKFASDKYGLKVKVSSLDAAGYPDDFFDVVTLNMALEHIDEPKKHLIEIKKILKNRGLLFIEVPNTDSLMLKIAALYFWLKKKNWSPVLSPLHYPYHCYGYNKTSIKYLLSAAGMRIEKMFIRDSSLRGFRPDSGGTAFEKIARNAITKLAGFVGQGDVLIVLSENRKD